MTNHQGDESTLILDFDIANSAQTEYCSTFHFPSVPPWPLGPLGPMDHMDNLDILHHLDHSHRSNHFDNPDWSMINQEDNCRIRIVYLALLVFCLWKGGMVLLKIPITALFHIFPWVYFFILVVWLLWMSGRLLSRSGTIPGLLTLISSGSKTKWQTQHCNFIFEEVIWILK